MSHASTRLDAIDVATVPSHSKSMTARPDTLPRVLFVNHTSRTGGAELILLSILPDFAQTSSLWAFHEGPLCDRARDRAVKVLLPAKRTNFAGIRRDRNLIRALPMLFGMAGMVAGIARAARQHDVIYANSQKAFVLSAFAAAISRRPLIWHLHDILTPAHFGSGQRRLLRWLACRATQVIVPSQAAADAFVTLTGEGNRVRVVSNGVTLSPDGMEGHSRTELRHLLGLPNGFLFGIFSRLSPWKGQDVALRALALRPDISCIVVGDALFGEDAYADSLRRMVHDLGIADRVHFLGYRNDVQVLMRAVDVVVHPSRDPEPFGRTLVEAMLCRTPVIATATGAAPEILSDGVNGFLVPPNDSEAIARAIDHIRSAPDMTEAVVGNGARRAVEFFSENEMRNGIRDAVMQTVRSTTHHQ